MLTPVGVSIHFLPSILTCTSVYLSNVYLLSLAKMDAGRQRALVRVSATMLKQKEKEGVPTSAPKVVGKGSSKRENEGKDDRPLKKGPIILVGDKQSKNSSPPKPSHGASKGLMTVMSLITQGTIRHLLTHKEHAVEMVVSIIKETDLDPCAKQTT